MRMKSRGTCFLKWGLTAIALLSITDSVLIPLMVYRLCYQSTSILVQSQCVNCPFLALQGYSFSCFGNTAFPRNMTPTQAQCMIQRCQDGVKQTPVYLGRKRRDDSEEKESHGETSTEAPGKDNIQVVGKIDVLVDMDFDYEEPF